MRANPTRSSCRRRTWCASSPSRPPSSPPWRRSRCDGHRPAVGILVDGHRVHTLQLGLSIFFEVTGLVAGIHGGRLAAVHAGRGDIGLALTIHELEVLTKRSHLELPGVKSLQRGFRLLPASAYPDESHAQHLGGQALAGHPSGAALPNAVTAAARFPGVDLTDGHVPATNLDAA